MRIISIGTALMVVWGVLILGYGVWFALYTWIGGIAAANPCQSKDMLGDLDKMWFLKLTPLILGLWVSYILIQVDKYKKRLRGSQNGQS